MNSVVGALTA